jgi:hypothetical protein
MKSQYTMSSGPYPLFGCVITQAGEYLDSAFSLVYTGV